MVRGDGIGGRGGLHAGERERESDIVIGGDTRGLQLLVVGTDDDKRRQCQRWRWMTCQKERDVAIEGDVERPQPLLVETNDGSKRQRWKWRTTTGERRL